MTKPTAPLLLIVALGLAACNSPNLDRTAGHEVDEGGFGNATANNMLVQTGQRDATFALGTRFAAEVPSTITFPFNSADLTPEARAALMQQADWIRQFPELRFSVYGHTDAVGSNAYNKSLGLRRAKAVVNFFASQGISPSRLEALVSYGETRPVIATPGPEQQNRRTVTEVSGFVKNHPGLLNGKYAEVIFRAYVASATPTAGTPAPAGAAAGAAGAAAAPAASGGSTGGTATGPTP
ncbi:OmpA family protein [Paragemmobacter straminiformis]|uniref:OmpA family protein n=1 Tax=Paragemmobacter straminiformis TaxID=2045119 RepID=A0A842I3B0_9RHOB|nr:OmpA family protein [Gemmobacter straminiformis]MBC2834370.1 OmpA family protein [Gemmobacter straminiformis]